MESRVLLCVEDSDPDYYLIKMAVWETGLPVQLWRVSDGEQALDFLHRSSGYGVAPRPDLILLDLNVPRKNGLEVLSEIRASESLRSIPVVVFTSSTLPTDREEALILGAQDYISKPGTLDGLLNVLRFICHRFLAEAG